MKVPFPLVLHGTPAFEATLGRLLASASQSLDAVEESVRRTISEVRARGDAALREITLRFEGRKLEVVEVSSERMDAAIASVSPLVARALEEASSRIRRFHEEELRHEAVFSVESDGVRTAVLISPMSRVGAYAPGGKARYPSSVLMTAIPAVVAGVPEVVLASPSPPPETLLAARLAGVSRVFDLGGAQAIAALAYGTETVPSVDLVAGPGSVWVTAAKRLVYGDVAIDGLAGPSEAVIVADDSADPEWVAADLLTQAEHDEASGAVLVTTSEDLAKAAVGALAALLDDLPRREIAARALAERGAAFVVPGLEEALAVASRLAPEHLSLVVREPREALAGVGPAGAIFLGAFTPQTTGDYAAGPSHVLPTARAARFGSPLGVRTFLRRSSVVEYSRAALAGQSEVLTTLARAEGFEGHARAVETRRRG